MAAVQGLSRAVTAQVTGDDAEMVCEGRALLYAPRRGLDPVSLSVAWLVPVHSEALVAEMLGPRSIPPVGRKPTTLKNKK
jgi:hypothetical protein